MERVHYPPYSFGFWPRYWVHMRPYLLFVSGAAGLVGLALAPQPPLDIVVLAMVPFFMSYGLGQALTDVFQTDTDAISAGYRPLVRGEVSRRAVFAVSLGGLLGGAAIMAYIDRSLLVLGLLATFGLVLYTPFKRRWWGGPAWNSWIVALLVLMGFVAVSPQHGALRAAPPTLFSAITAVFFAYANFVIGGYFKDVSADKATNYQTIQVRFGWRAGAIWSDVVSVAAAAATALTLLWSPHLKSAGGAVAVVIWVLAIAVNWRAQATFHRVRDERLVGDAIGYVVHAFVLYCAAIVAAAQPAWLAFLVAYYALFALALRHRPQNAQV